MKMSFENSTLLEVAEVISSTYHMSISVSDVVMDCTITVEFDQKDLASVLKVLKTRGCDEVSYENAQKHGVLLTERGSSFGYGNMVVDMRSLVIMRAFAPVLFDATHSVQMPGSGGGSTGGDSTMIPYLSRAAAAVGVDGFFFETHFDPSIALSDGPNMIPLNELETLTEKLIKITEIKE